MVDCRKRDYGYEQSNENAALMMVKRGIIPNASRSQQERAAVAQLIIEEQDSFREKCSE